MLIHESFRSYSSEGPSEFGAHMHESINNPRNGIFRPKDHDIVKISMRKAQTALLDWPNGI